MDTENLSLSDANATASGRHLLDQAARFRRWGRPKAAVQAYRLAIASALDTAGRYSALMGLARSLDAAGEKNEALIACQDAIAVCPDEAPAYGLLALLFMHEGELTQAAHAASDAWQRDEVSAAMPCLVASIALQRGRIDQAVVAISAALAREPTSQRARALRGIALGLRDGEAAWPDLERLVTTSNPTAPDGFSSLASFNDALFEAINAHDMLESEHANGPLVNGARLHDMFTLPDALAEALRDMFLSEVRLHAADNVIAPRLEVRAWANVMEAGAYEKPHIHEGGWLSAVYYPRVPAQSGGGGEIVFGAHDLGPDVPSQSPFRLLPSPGQMIVFPSWLYHSTAPFAGEGIRVSIAADIVRAD